MILVKGVDQMSPYRYQLTKDEFRKEWGLMSPTTLSRRKSWAQDNYPQWRKVFLYGGRIDLREYQKFQTFYSEKQYEAHQDPHLKYLEEM